MNKRKIMIIALLVFIMLVIIKVVWVTYATTGHGSFDNEKKDLIHRVLSIGQTILPQWSALLHRTYSTKCQVELVSSSKASGLYTHVP